MADPDSARKYLDAALAAAGVDMKAASLMAGRNHAYIQQYIRSGKPLWLPESVRDALVRSLPQIDANQLRPPPVRSRLPQGPLLGDRQNQAQIDPPRQGKLVDDPGLLHLLDVWSRITNPADQALALSILRTMAERNSAVAA